MIQILLYIIFYTIFAFFISIFFHTFLYIIGLWEKISITIKLPKSKKYENKVDPIYELRQNEWSTDVYIYKWSLMYYQKVSWYSFLILLIPYPIILQTFGYNIEDNVYVCERKNVMELGDDLKTIYENEMEKIREKENIKNEKRNKIKNKFDTLNQIFNENYE